MATEVIMPKVDMDQESGTVLEWLKQEGQQVKEGEPLLVIETDKVSIEVESPGTGVLAGVSAQPDDNVPIGTVIAYLLAEGEALPAGSTPPTPQDESAAPELPTKDGKGATPVARRLAQASGLPLDGMSGSGPGGRVTKSDVQAALDGQSDPDAPEGPVRATPAARRVARQEQVDLAAIQGSGPKGRVQEADAKAAAHAQSQAPAARRPIGTDEVQVIPLQGMRRRIAERMTASYQAIPHINFTSKVDMSAFNAARQEWNQHAQASGAGRVSATAVFVKCVAAALDQHPWLNAQLQGDEIHIYPHAHIGVAVALEDGLIVPVVHDADQKGIGEIAAQVDDLAGRARAGQLLPAEVNGGTFTISNLGPFGIEQFTALINPPQVAILAIGATQQEASVLADGSVAARPLMRMTLAVDHRAVDGALAAQFMSTLKGLLEQPLLLAW